MVKHQGSLDALCGVYAIINALAICKIHEAETIFKLACEALPDGGVTEGTDFDELKNILSNLPLPKYRLKVNFPFEQETFTPKSNNEYWEKFDEIFSDEANLCGIIGITKPTEHWIAVHKPSGTRVKFTDSEAGKKEPIIKNRSSLYAGYKRQKPTQWLIDRQELVIFRRI